MADKRPMRDDLVQAILLVQAGFTFGEAADELRLTRNQVAGACDRAGVKAPLTPDKAARAIRRMSAAQRTRWANASPATREAWSKACSEARGRARA